MSVSSAAPRRRCARRDGPRTCAPPSELALEPGDVTLDAPDRLRAADADVVVDATGCAVLPGFVDCHTHLPFAGWRAEEYERKVTGVPYEEIARAGGGIASSARSLAAASDEEVLAQATALASELLGHGTTAFEGRPVTACRARREARAARLGRALAGVAPWTRPACT